MTTTAHDVHELYQYLCVKDADMAVQFCGEPSCRIRDPFGHIWCLGHSIEQMSPDEMQRRYTSLFEDDDSH